MTENAFAETDRHDRVEIAKRWLRRQLDDGRLPSSEIKRRAREAGIGRDSLWEAKRALDISAVKQGDPPRWHWISPAERNMSGLDLDAETLVPHLPGLTAALKRMLQNRGLT